MEEGEVSSMTNIRERVLSVWDDDGNRGLSLTKHDVNYALGNRYTLPYVSATLRQLEKEGLIESLNYTAEGGLKLYRRNGENRVN